VSTDDDFGIRRFSKFTPAELQEKTFNWVRDLTTFFIVGNWKGFLLKIAWGVIAGISARAVFSMFVAAKQAFMTFNFNITDAQIDQIVKGIRLSWIEQFGEVVGEALGWVVGGFIPSFFLFRFNEAMAAAVLQEVSEEFIDEMAAQVDTLIYIGASNELRVFGMRMFQGIRALIKRAAYGESDTLAGGLIENLLDGFPGAKESIKQWGSPGSKPWTLSNKLEEAVEKIKNENIRALVEGLLDGFDDGFIEAGYVVAGGIDRFRGEQKLLNRSLLGDQRIVELELNRDAVGDQRQSVILAGPEQLVRQELIRTMNQATVLDERDVGLWVGEPIREALIAPPISIQMRVILSDMEGVLHGRKRVQITIPDVRRERIDWARLKQACGGQNGYMWGAYKCQARLSGGNEMHIYAASEQEGMDRINELAYFSNQEIIGVTAVRELREGKRRTIDALYKQPTRIYPYAFTIINQQRVLNEESGRAQLSGMYRSRKASMIPLWEETRPDGFTEILQELFTTPGPND
jgi:hypothetical protein